jgi:hypothetical protein
MKSGDAASAFMNRDKLMEFHIVVTEAASEPNVIENALFDIDPTAVADLDMSGLVLRISSSATIADLIVALGQTGWVVTPEQVVQLPSICCGGCGG